MRSGDKTPVIIYLQRDWDDMYSEAELRIAVEVRAQMMRDAE